MSSPTIASIVIAELQAFAPFNEITAAQLAPFVRALTLRFFARGDTIIAPTHDAPDMVFILKSGAIVGERVGFSGHAVAALSIAEGEMFPIGAVLTDRPIASTFRATADCLVYAMPSAHFKEQLRNIPILQDFCERRLFHLLERSRAHLRAAYAAEALSEHPFARELASTIKREPVVIPEVASIALALQTMHDAKVGAVVMVDGQQHAVGILTERDVIGRVVLPQRALTQPARDVASDPVLTLDEKQPISAATLLMVSKNIRHVVITREERVVGVVSERSLFALQRQTLASVSDAISSAHSIEALVHCGRDIRELSRTLVAQGVASGLLTEFISQLNDQLCARAIALISVDHAVTRDLHVRWCWLAFGSEGRHEQTISTDQDNGLIFESASSATDVKAQMLAFASQVNAALAACGYPICKGNIMASNPALTLTTQDWIEKFKHWIDAGDPQSLLNANIFFDMRALAGDTALAREVENAIFPHAQANARFRKQMADNALTNRPPLSWLGNIDPSNTGTVDLKREGAMPFTDAARLMAIAAGVRATRTQDRLRESAKGLRIPETEVEGWIGAFEFVQMLRLRHQHARLSALEAGRATLENANEISVNAMSPLDVRILRESFRQARKVQQRLEADYQ